MLCCRRGTNQIDRPLAILTFGFANNVDVTAGLVLDISDGLSSTTNDQADRPVGH
jgi:hypothetical protein